MEVLQLKHYDDERGSLLPIEFNDLPFKPKRAFIVNNVPIGVRRGNHSHYVTQQLIICTKGSVEVILHDGNEEKSFILKQNNQILVPQLVWDTQVFLTTDAEILVFCSTLYDVNDYIFDFQKFLQIKQTFKK